MPVPFTSFPANNRVPGVYTEVDPTKALSGTPAALHHILLLGTKITAGTVLEAVPTKIVGEDDGFGYFGVGSPLAEMCKYARRANPRTKITAIALNEAAAGTAAAGTWTFTGTVTKAGSLAFYVGDRRVAIAVALGDTPTALATKLDTALDADPRIPFSSAAAVGVVTSTAKWKGPEANEVKFEVARRDGDTKPADLGLTVAVVQPTGGATAPTLSTALAVLGDETYDTVVSMYTDATSIASLESEMATRWGPLSQKEGHVFAAKADTHANLTTYGAARNSPFVTVMGYSGKCSEPWKWASQVAGVSALEPHPGRPRNTLVLPDIEAPALADRFNATQRQLLLEDGISTYTVDAGGLVRVESLITTYQKNPQNMDDPTYLDATTMFTLKYLRTSLRYRLAKYARSKIANDGTAFLPGAPVVTPKQIRGDILDLARTEWEAQGHVEDLATFETDLIVERNAGDATRVDIYLPPNITNELKTLAALVAFRL